MQKLLRSKWLYLVLGIVLLFVFGSVIYRSPIAERGIVIGLGIDEADDGLSVSFEMIMPGDDSKGKGTYLIEEQKAKNLAEAIEGLSSRLGVTVSLGHCTVLVLGEKAVESVACDSLLYLERTGKVRDNTMVIATEGSAKELFLGKLPNGEIISFYFSSSLAKEQKSSGINELTLAEFCKNILGGKNCNVMPYVTKIDEGGAGGGQGEGQDAAKQEGGEVGQSGEATKTSSYDFKQSLVRLPSGGSYVMDGDSAFGRSLVMSRVTNGQVKAEIEKKEYSAKISRVSKKLKYSPKEDLLRIQLKVYCKADDYSYQNAKEPNEVQQKEAFSASIKGAVEKTFIEAKQKDADIFNIYEGFLRAGVKNELSKAGGYYLARARIEVEVVIYKM